MTWMTIAAAAALFPGSVPGQDQATPPRGQSVAAANAEAHARSEDQIAVVDTTNARAEDVYARDMATYRTERRIAAADARLYARQQRAYADAMAAWRLQVEDCRRGRRAACEAPTPDPADFR